MKNQNHYRKSRIVPLLDKGFVTASQASQELGVTTRHLRRLLKEYRDHGKRPQALLAKPRTAAWNGTTDKIIKRVVALKKENIKRSNQRIAEMVANDFDKRISPYTVRNILLRNDCYVNSKRERRVFDKLEQKITGSGQMLQMDTCEGVWLKGYRRVYLIAIMDAYSRYVLGWQWVASDSAWNNISVLRAVIEQYGVPEMLYTDNASFFKVIKHNQSIYQKHKPVDEYQTTIERIMLELGGVLVTHKPYQPQGKGRIERFFRFMQDRFINEHTAKDLDELNKQFKPWVKWYNERHVIRTIRCTPKDRLHPEGFRPVLKDLNLDKVFSYQYIRKVDKYNSFSFEKNSYTINPDIDCFVAFKVQLYVTDKEIAVYYHDHLVQKFERLSKDKK